MPILSGNLDRIRTFSTNEPQVIDILAGRAQRELLEDKLDTAKLNRFEVDTTLRTHLTYIFSTVIFLWLASVIAVLFFNNYLFCINLSDQVLTVLLTTTSINVIGMMLIILKNLFPKNNH